MKKVQEQKLENYYKNKYEQELIENMKELNTNFTLQSQFNDGEKMISRNVTGIANEFGVGDMYGILKGNSVNESESFVKSNNVTDWQGLSDKLAEVINESKGVVGFRGGNNVFVNGNSNVGDKDKQRLELGSDSQTQQLTQPQQQQEQQQTQQQTQQMQQTQPTQQEQQQQQQKQQTQQKSTNTIPDHTQQDIQQATTNVARLPTMTTFATSGISIGSTPNLFSSSGSVPVKKSVQNSQSNVQNQQIIEQNVQNSQITQQNVQQQQSSPQQIPSKQPLQVQVPEKVDYQGPMTRNKQNQPNSQNRVEIKMPNAQSEQNDQMQNLLPPVKNQWMYKQGGGNELSQQQKEASNFPSISSQNNFNPPPTNPQNTNLITNIPQQNQWMYKVRKNITEQSTIPLEKPTKLQQNQWMYKKQNLKLSQQNQNTIPGFNPQNQILTPENSNQVFVSKTGVRDETQSSTKKDLLLNGEKYNNQFLPGFQNIIPKRNDKPKKVMVKISNKNNPMATTLLQKNSNNYQKSDFSNEMNEFQEDNNVFHEFEHANLIEEDLERSPFSSLIQTHATVDGGRKHLTT